LPVDVGEVTIIPDCLHQGVVLLNSGASQPVRAGCLDTHGQKRHRDQIICSKALRVLGVAAVAVPSIEGGTREVARITELRTVIHVELLQSGLIRLALEAGRQMEAHDGEYAGWL